MSPANVVVVQTGDNSRLTVRLTAARHTSWGAELREGGRRLPHSREKATPGCQRPPGPRAAAPSEPPALQNLLARICSWPVVVAATKTERPCGCARAPPPGQGFSGVFMVLKVLYSSGYGVHFSGQIAGDGAPCSALLFGLLAAKTTARLKQEGCHAAVPGPPPGQGISGGFMVLRFRLESVAGDGALPLALLRPPPCRQDRHQTETGRAAMRLCPGHLQVKGCQGFLWFRLESILWGPFFGPNC